MAFADMRACCRAHHEDLQTTRWETAFKLSAGSGSALRLLYAFLQPLEPNHNDVQGYREFLGSIQEDLRQMITCTDVLACLREALTIPCHIPLLLLLLVDEGQAAEQQFPPPQACACPAVSRHAMHQACSGPTP